MEQTNIHPPADAGARETVPRSLLSDIPEEFWYAFGGELVSVFGAHAMEESYLERASSTCGFSAAFRAACGKLGLPRLYERSEKLAWYDYDIFADCIAKETLLRFRPERRRSPNPYFMLIARTNLPYYDGPLCPTGTQHDSRSGEQ